MLRVFAICFQLGRARLLSFSDASFSSSLGSQPPLSGYGGEGVGAGTGCNGSRSGGGGGGGGVLDVCSVDCFGPELRSGSYFDRFSELIQTCTIPPHWSHIVWWKALLHIWQNRVALHPEPIRVEWVPAHKSDHIPLHEVNETVGQALGIQLRHLRCNRIADQIARELANSSAPVDPVLFETAKREVFTRQAQLALLNQRIGTDIAIKVLQNKGRYLRSLATF